VCYRTQLSSRGAGVDVGWQERSGEGLEDPIKCGVGRLKAQLRRQVGGGGLRSLFQLDYLCLAGARVVRRQASASVGPGGWISLPDGRKIARRESTLVGLFSFFSARHTPCSATDLFPPSPSLFSHRSSRMR
jgi:hypothetical protein